MKAMILAAGLGTRLRPLTDSLPKALVTIGGRTLLEITLHRLRAFGITEVIVNTHHHAEMVEEYLRSRDYFGMRIEISREDFLLDTGGGLKKTAQFFLEQGPSFGQPFILHNVDVISNIDLGRMTRFHLEQAGLATLAVQQRSSSRLLLFDSEDWLCGRRVKVPTEAPDTAEFSDQLVRPCAAAQAMAFSGIHVISPQIFTKMPKADSFSIIDAYLDLAAHEEKILAWPTDASHWRDLGTPASLLAAERELSDGFYEKM